MKKHVRSNLKRCPLLKITRVENTYDDKGNLIKSETIEDFNDCFKSFCTAWDTKTNRCSYFDVSPSEGQPKKEDDDED